MLRARRADEDFCGLQGACGIDVDLEGQFSFLSQGPYPDSPRVLCQTRSVQHQGQLQAPPSWTPTPPPAPFCVGREHHLTQHARHAQWRPLAGVLCPGHTRQEEAALRPEWGQRRPCLQGESHLLSCERPCASSLGFGFLVRSSSPLADVKLRGEEETEAGLAHLEGNASAEMQGKCKS